MIAKPITGAITAGVVALALSACGGGAPSAPSSQRVARDMFGIIGTCGAGPHNVNATQATNDLVQLARKYGPSAKLSPRPEPTIKTLGECDAHSRHWRLPAKQRAAPTDRSEIAVHDGRRQADG